MVKKLEMVIKKSDRLFVYTNNRKHIFFKQNFIPIFLINKKKSDRFYVYTKNRTIFFGI